MKPDMYIVKDDPPIRSKPRKRERNPMENFKALAWVIVIFAVAFAMGWLAFYPPEWAGS